MFLLQAWSAPEQVIATGPVPSRLPFRFPGTSPTSAPTVNRGWWIQPRTRPSCGRTGRFTSKHTGSGAQAEALPVAVPMFASQDAVTSGRLQPATGRGDHLQQLLQAAAGRKGEQGPASL